METVICCVFFVLESWQIQTTKRKRLNTLIFKRNYVKRLIFYRAYNKNEEHKYSRSEFCYPEDLIQSNNFHTLQAESPSIFLDKSGRGRRLCEWLQDSLIRCSSEKMDESVQFPVGQTGFLLTRIIIHLSGFSTAICMYKCRDHVNCTRANKLSLRVFSWCYRLFTLQNYLVYKKFKSRSVRSPKTNTCKNNLFACRFDRSQSHSCMRMAIEKPDPSIFSYKF